MKIYIYILRHPETQQVHYVGKTNNIRIRMKGHRNLRGTTRCDRWKKDLRARGLEPIIQVVEECGENWISREQYWIDYYRALGCDLMNTAAAGAGPEVRNQVSDATRELLRNKFKGRPIPNEQRVRISASLTGKKQSEETVAKRRATINANRISKGLTPWNFGRIEEVRLQRQREDYDRKARAAGKPIRYSPEWVQKRLDSFNQTVSKLTPEERARRAAHLNENPVRYWKGKKRGPHSPEVREKIRQSNLATRKRQREERCA